MSANQTDPGASLGELKQWLHDQARAHDLNYNHVELTAFLVKSFTAVEAAEKRIAALQAKVDALEWDRADLIAAIGFKPTAMDKESSRAMVIESAVGHRREMVKARQRVSEIEGSLGHWFDEEFLKERIGSQVALKIWNKAKEMERDRDRLHSALQKLVTRDESTAEEYSEQDWIEARRALSGVPLDAARKEAE